MATFKAEVSYKRADGTYNVQIRVTHNRVIRRISTNLYVTDADLTRSLKIKNPKIIKNSNALIEVCREACNDLGFGIASLSVNELVEKLKTRLKGGERFKLDFIKYMGDKADGMKKSTGGLYRTTANALKRYTDRDSLDIFEITTDFLKGFEDFLLNEPSQRGSNRKSEKEGPDEKKGRAVSSYLGNIRATFNNALSDYNNEEKGVISIPYSPFKNFKIKPQPKTRKRALTVEQIQKIVDLPYTDNFRYNLAKDCFILSFVLIGMNSADMFYANPLNGDVLIYNRRKTEGRRDDSAEMRVQVDSCLALLLEKYHDKTRLFNFYKRYSDHTTFNRAINKGLKLIGAKIGVDNLEFYAARHSWATVARSSAVDIDKATVHEALNHVDVSMKITDIYIDRDWSVVWNANKRVLGLFNWAVVENDLL